MNSTEYSPISALVSLQEHVDRRNKGVIVAWDDGNGMYRHILPGSLREEFPRNLYEPKIGVHGSHQFIVLTLILGALDTLDEHSVLRWENAWMVYEENLMNLLK